jgi:DtxR family Mn-dependent transcriptional regulator
MPSEIVEEYLEAIFKLGSEGRDVGLSRLAEHLKVTPASVSETVRRMEAQGLVRYQGRGRGRGPAADSRSGGGHRHGRPSDDEPQSLRKGVTLTAKGERLARTLVRRHRLSERFLTDMLGMDWEKAHQEACKLEHALSPETEGRLADLLGNPDTCPHGHPIPDADGRIRERKLKKLSECGEDERGCIDRVEEEEPQMLQYLSSLGLLPEVEVEVKEVAPFNGPLLVKAGGAQYALGREVASKIWLRKK